ncbi:MAG TPA: penicillin-binding protein 1C [Methylococcaceae bacterium]|nr:penicillin-binding protein 1C [Methylococcaceae bacterium]
MRTRLAALRYGTAVLAICLAALAAVLPTAGTVPAFAEVKSAWRPSEAHLLDRHGAILDSHRVDLRARRLPWTPLAEFSPVLLRAILAAEDRRFYRHGGVDWSAVAAAAFDRLRGRPLRGASTVTMQLAALLDPSLAAANGKRTLRQKLVQWRTAWTLEKSWSKEQILEAYLNRVGFRGELQGVTAAAQGLFGKRPSGLGEAESAILAAILPSPNATPERIAGRACAIARAADFRVACGELHRQFQLIAMQPYGNRPSPALAPHLAARLVKSAGVSVYSTLDATVQRLALDALGRQLQGLGQRNVRDGAAVVVDNASGEVLAYVGSAGPWSGAAGVDGVRARRQAGSTLKPFLYALALERRYLTAASVLDDSPLNLETSAGLYVPQNYDRDFKGLVSVRTALASSLNIPAVRTLILVGVEAFRDRLRAIGYEGIAEDGEYYGYALALGSAEVSLLEQVDAYRTLANGGMYSALRLVPGDDRVEPRRAMDGPAAFIVSDILSDRAGRALSFGFDNPLATRYWTAVKTGTSKDMRDNWCIGYSERFTVGVWVGNFEGDAMHDVSGVTGAAPAWLEIMDGLHAGLASHARSAPPEVVRTPVKYEPAVEPERSEWFIAGTETPLVRLPGARQAAPRIESPPNGVVIALDPDIPRANQLALLRASGAEPGMSLRLDGKRLGPATRIYKWRPIPGAHQLDLRAADGKTHHSVRFKVRGLERAAGNN